MRITVTAACSRQSAHSAPIRMGWMMMKPTLTAPSGRISSPNSRTSHGMVRQRRWSPMMPVRMSSM
jgi:hypothetical protein